jgi:glycosyltransferase involved in cell wall biosynthesis
MIELQAEPTETRAGTPLPFVSVVMPIRNEGSFITTSLGAVLAQDYPVDRIEIIVADGMSSDNTREVVRSLQEQYPRVRLVDNPGRYVPTGLNAAIREARGEIIVRVDGHTIIAPDYVRECVAALSHSGASNVGGRMDAVTEGRVGGAIALATSSPFGVGGARFHYSQQEEWVDTVYLGAWHRETFSSIGLFDEEQVRNQDDEFNYRLRAQGGKVLLTPRIRSSYYNRATLRSLWRQYFQYGYWKVRVLQKHPLQMRPRQFAPPLFVLGLLVGTVLAPFYQAALYAWLGILATYALANLSASLVTARRGGWRHLPLLPLVFAVLHVSYGLGFLLGLVRFANRWRKPHPLPRLREAAANGT